MQFRTFLTSVVLIWCSLASSSFAVTVSLNPSDDGSFYTCSNCVQDPRRGRSLYTGSYIVGVVKFDLPEIRGTISGASLSFQYHSLPQKGDRIIDVWGFESETSSLDRNELYFGSSLGKWTVPVVRFNERVNFDVSSLFTGATPGYVGFTLFAPTSGHGFVSGQAAAGFAPQLDIEVTPVPIPGPLPLLIGAFGVLLARKGIFCSA